MIYLDNAATSFPKPPGVAGAMGRVVAEVGGSPGRSSHRMALEAARLVFAVREKAAALLGVDDSSRIVFTKNATESINLALKGLVRAGDHVVTTAFEHDSVAATLRALEAAGAEVTRLRPAKGHTVGPDDVRKALRPATRMVVMTHASNVLGAIQPIAEVGGLCRSRGVLFMADCAQTAGALPVDAESMAIDVLAATGHKSLLGPQGTGLLYLREGVEPAPLLHGGTGSADRDAETPERLEAGTLNTPGIAGLGAAIDFLAERTVAALREREIELTARLLEGLASIKGVTVLGPREPEKRVPLVSFNIGGLDPQQVGMRLDGDFSIMVRCGLHCAPDAHSLAGTMPRGAVRASPGCFTTEDHIDALIAAVKEIAAGAA
ncbi:MAG TPA: aminotransferase class V-fold PLP-dependent enzyme [Deltaproteobacteria bacterium]|nr:aminotransferase class V-fold PLP-dependent enzyme [Deltaproteobacteria bacterium]